MRESGLGRHLRGNSHGLGRLMRCAALHFKAYSMGLKIVYEAGQARRVRRTNCSRLGFHTKSIMISRHVLHIKLNDAYIYLNT